MEKAEFIIAAVETIEILNDLARMTANGFVPFSKCDGDADEDGTPWEDKIVYLDDPADGSAEMSENDVLADIVTDCGHHDAVSHYGGILSDIMGCGVKVDVVGAGDPDKEYVCVHGGGMDVQIQIFNGGWHLA